MRMHVSGMEVKMTERGISFDIECLMTISPPVNDSWRSVRDQIYFSTGPRIIIEFFGFCFDILILIWGYSGDSQSLATRWRHFGECILPHRRCSRTFPLIDFWISNVGSLYTNKEQQRKQKAKKKTVFMELCRCGLHKTINYDSLFVACSILFLSPLPMHRPELIELFTPEGTHLKLHWRSSAHLAGRTLCSCAAIAKKKNWSQIRNEFRGAEIMKNRRLFRGDRQWGKGSVNGFKLSHVRWYH